MTVGGFHCDGSPIDETKAQTHFANEGVDGKGALHLPANPTDAMYNRWVTD